MSTQDHFNYPTPNRIDTMYLSSLQQTEGGFAKKTFYRDRSPNLDISDIEKARPHYHGYQYSNKEVYINRNDDIAGSHPKKLHQPLEKAYYNLRNDDISGSKPQSHKFVTTREASNPLNPVYKLPHAEIRISTPPKFVRDQIDIKDIDGARPNPYNRYGISRKTNMIDDIEGARPRKEWIPQGKQSSLDVRDINYFWEFHTKRETNPLSPRYKIVNEENKLYNYGEIDNKAKVRHPKEVNKVTSLDLKTSDIDGAQASTATRHVTKIATRDDFMKTNDIPGAQTSTLKKGITTTRHLDPLWPLYKVPGHSEPAPVYTKNQHSALTSKYGAKTTSDFSSFKTTAVSPANEGFKTTQLSQISELPVHKVEPIHVHRQNSGENAAPVLRKPSGEKTPVQKGDIQPTKVEKRLPSPLAQTGQDLVGGKTFSNTEYVPARMSSLDDDGFISKSTKQKNITRPGMNLETKKALNSNENYQNNVKNFWGMPASGDAKNLKSMSAAEKMDKYISY